MLLAQRYAPMLASGAVDVLFRRWRTSQVRAGHVYRTAAGRVEVLDVRTVDPTRISRVDARRAGHLGADDVRAELRGDPADPVFRLHVRLADGPDPRAVLAADAVVSGQDRAELDARLARLDRASTHGPWTRVTLEVIAARPGVRAPDLATDLGRETQPFKLDVRKLKALGLTLSLRVGYELSPRGAAYLGGGSP